MHRFSIFQWNDIWHLKTGSKPADFDTLTSIYARATTGCTFFWTSHSGPTLKCFLPFWLGKCFAPQWRTLLRHLNFQKWSETVSFWYVWLLSTTTACNFSSSSGQLAPHPPLWQAYFSNSLFDIPEPQNIGTHSAPRLSHLFAHLHLLASTFLSLSHLWLSLLTFFSAFHLSTLKEVWLLNFLRPMVTTGYIHI